MAKKSKSEPKAAVTLTTNSSPMQFCDATSAAFTVTLPLPTTATNGVTTGAEPFVLDDAASFSRLNASASFP